jgi:CubicO group peptidase (beta-lactamase class C family)
LGLLLARDGTWDGQRILPEGWVDFMRTPSPAALNNWPADEVPGTSYGAFTILYDIDPKSARIPIDTFGHQGFGGSVFQVRPSNDTILIVYGAGVPSGDAAVDKERHVRAIAAMFPAMSGSKTRVHTAEAAGENANG